MFNLILIWLSLGSFVVLFVILSLRIIALRQGREFELTGSDFYRSGQLFFDHLAFNLVQAVRLILARVFIFLVNGSHQLITMARKGISRAEKHFAKIADIVNGKGQLPERGTMSLFLKEIDLRK